MGKNIARIQSRPPIQISLPAMRKGRMGDLDLGHDYMARVEARARALRKATKVTRSKGKPAIQPKCDDR